MIRRAILLLSFSAVSLTSFSQQKSDDKAHKSYLSNAYWLNLRYDHYLKSGSFLYFENSSRFSSDPYPLGNSFPFNQMYQMYFMAGYEHKATDHWYLGLSEKIELDPGITTIYYTRLNISHRGKIGGLKFIKEAAFEHLKYPKSNIPGVVNQNYGRVSFSAGLLKEFKVGKSKLYTIFSYRAYVIFDLLNDGYSAYANRTIDRTEMRFEVDYFLTERLLVSVFAIRPTDYFSPSGRYNNIQPTFGLGLNYVVKAPKDYIPGFPIK